MRLAIRFLLTSILVVLTTAAGHAQNSAPAQQPAATFKADVNLVEVHAVVTDARGQFVSGLSKDDFEIYESGKLQQPTIFHVVDTPLVKRAASISATAVEPDVRETVPRFEGRLFVIVLDD